jgi:hypothetical protein
MRGTATARVPCYCYCDTTINQLPATTISLPVGDDATAMDYARPLGERLLGPFEQRVGRLYIALGYVYLVIDHHGRGQDAGHVGGRARHVGYSIDAQ